MSEKIDLSEWRGFTKYLPALRDYQARQVERKAIAALRAEADKRQLAMRHIPTIRQNAKSLGVNPNALSSWIDRYKNRL